MTEEKPTYITEQEHEAKKKRIESIKDILTRYVAGEIAQAEATAEIEAITHEKITPRKPFEATIIWD